MDARHRLLRDLYRWAPQLAGENILILTSNYTELNTTIKAIHVTKTNARNLDSVDH